MTKIVLALTLSAATLAGAPVPALNQDPNEKDRCELKHDATELDRRLPEVAEEERSPARCTDQKKLGTSPGTLKGAVVRAMPARAAFLRVPRGSAGISLCHAAKYYCYAVIYRDHYGIPAYIKTRSPQEVLSEATT
jgi:hypothetical protein